MRRGVGAEPSVEAGLNVAGTAGTEAARVGRDVVALEAAGASEAERVFPGSGRWLGPGLLLVGACLIGWGALGPELSTWRLFAGALLAGAALPGSWGLAVYLGLTAGSATVLVLEPGVLPAAAVLFAVFLVWGRLRRIRWERDPEGRARHPVVPIPGDPFPPGW